MFLFSMQASLYINFTKKERGKNLSAYFNASPFIGSETPFSYINCINIIYISQFA
jgi:hypothetical protein